MLKLMSTTPPEAQSSDSSGSGLRAFLIALAVVVAAAILFTGGVFVGNSGDQDQTDSPSESVVPPGDGDTGPSDSTPSGGTERPSDGSGDPSSDPASETP
jgi:hypothetical protein